MNRYESYQDSGIPWLGEVPAHWYITKLKYIADIFRGKFTHRPRNDPNLYDGQYPFFQTGDIANAKKYLLHYKQTLNENGLSVSTLIPRGTIVITIAANIGDVAILDIDACFPDSVVGFRPYYFVKNNFLYYFLANMKQQFIDSSVKNIQMNLNVERVGANYIVIPPLPEQTAIADYLDNKLGEIDALISKQETLLEKLAEQRTAIITHAVTKGLNAHAPMKNSGVAWLGDVPEHWEVIKNKFILEFSKGLTITKENLLDEGVPCVNYGEIHSKYGFEVNPKKHILKCVSEEYLKTAQNALLENGDFVFADTSEDIKGSGNFTYLSDDTPIFAGYHTIIAKPNRNKIFPRFLAYVFESGGHRNQIREVVKGVKVFSITQAFLKNTFVWLPPLPEQTAIANYLDEQTAKIDRLSDTVNQTIASLKEYRSALITQAVTGKIKVV